MNKQYKFKCPICGKWKDIRQQGEHFEADCICNLDFFEKFHVVRLGLAKLLSTLRKLNIEVAEVCDKVRWKRPNVVFDSSLVWRGYGVNGKKYYYTVVKHKDEPNYIASRLRCQKPIRRTCKTLSEAKAACQADFQKRRAR